jgi:hypothetical protein
MKVIGKAVEQLRTSVLWIHGSSSRMDAFNKALESVEMDVAMKHPSKDLPTRWNATYLMIESSLPCKLAFQELSIQDDKFEDCPTEDQWDELRVMVEFLEPFYQGDLHFT